MPERRPLHEPIGYQSPEQRRRAYNATHARGSAVYGRRWQKLRNAYLATHPLCECGCDHPATVVDHRVPHNGDDGLMYSWNNLMAMTRACHDRKTATRDGGFGNPVRDGTAARPGRGVENRA